MHLKLINRLETFEGLLNTMKVSYAELTQTQIITNYSELYDV